MYKLGSLSIRHRAVGALIAVAIGASLLNIAVRLMSTGISPITQTYMRLGGGMIMSALVLRNSIRWSKLFNAPLKDYFVLLLMGTVGYSVGVYFITLGVLKTELVNVSVILAIQPFIIMIYSFFVFHEKIRLKLAGLLIFSLLGVALVATKSLIPHVANFGLGDLFILITAVCWGWYSIGRRLLSPYFQTSEVTMLVIFIAFVSSLLFAFFQHERVSLSSFSSWQVLLGLFIGSGFNLLSAQLDNFAYANLEIVFASQILLLENFFTPLTGFLFYHELVNFPQLIGALIIIGSVYFANKITNT